VSGLQRRAGPAGRFQVGPSGGQGPLLVLLPGIEGDPTVFSELGGLAADRPVEAWPLPEGPGLPVDLSVPVLAAALLAGLPAGPVCLLGASLGGLVAWEAAHQQPDRVRALVTLGSLPHPRHRPAGLALSAALVDRLPRCWVAARYRARIRARHAEEGVDPELSAALLARLPAPVLLARRLRAVASWDPLGPPPVPCLWLRGQVDTEAPWTTAQAQRELPGVEVQTVPGGHRAMLTHPQALVAAVRPFLRGR